MSKEKQSLFYIANLGPELCRYLFFKKENNTEQTENARKRFVDILYKIFSLQEISTAGRKELEMMVEYVLRQKDAKEEEVNKFFYPIILKLQN